MATVSVLLPDGATRTYNNIPSEAAYVARYYSKHPIGPCKYCQQSGYSYYKDYYVCPKCYLKHKRKHKLQSRGIAEKYTYAGSNRHRITNKPVDQVYMETYKWSSYIEP